MREFDRRGGGFSGEQQTGETHGETTTRPDRAADSVWRGGRRAGAKEDRWRRRRISELITTVIM